MAFPEVYMPSGYGIFSMTFDPADSNYQATCTFGFKNIPNYTAQEATIELLEVWYEAGRPCHIGQMSDQYTNVQTYCLLQHPSSETSWIESVNTTGVLTIGCVPPSNTLVVRKRTPYAGKRGRGRFAWPPMNFAETVVDSGGNIAGGTVTGLQALFDDALADMVSRGLPMVILHTRSTVDEEPTPTEVTALTVEPLLGIQRKRLRR